MSYQLLAVYALVGIALLAIARATYRTWFGKSKAGCGSGCGKCAAPAAEPTHAKRVTLPLVK